MNKLTKLFSYALLGGSLLTSMNSCKNPKSAKALEEKKYESPFIDLTGTVLKESYSRNFFNYSFSMDTQYGKKVVEVNESNRGNSKRSLELLIEPGTKVGINIHSKDTNEVMHIRYVDEIKILDN